MNVKDLPLKERPTWRVNYQAEHCSLVEVISALLGGKRSLETAEALVQKFSTAEAMASASPEEIAQVEGMTTSRAASLKGAVEFARRVNTKPNDRVNISTPEAAYELLSNMASLEQENFAIILLDARNNVIGDPITLYKSTLNSAHVRIAEVFRSAIKANSAAIITAHNHPTGDPSPSPEDIAITREIVQAGKLIDIDVLDHIIIGKGRFISLKAKNLGFD